MPTYEYRCATCDAAFDQRRPMADADAPASCPAGHPDGIRRLSSFAAITGSTRASTRTPVPVAGGGCGGACACNPG